MKFRVKVSKTISFYVEFELEPSILDLKNQISSKLPQNVVMKDPDEDIILSLNGSSPLQVNESQKVSKLGLVSGDIIWVLNVTSKRMTSDKNLEKFSHPTRIVECRDEIIPDCVKESLKHCCTNENECIVLILHHLMLELGFAPAFKIIPEGSQNYFKMSYKYHEENCVLLCTQMMSKMIINGYCSSTDRYSLVIDKKNYINDLGNENVAKRLKSLPELAILFINNIAAPLATECQWKLGITPTLLSTLPEEILIHIMRFLDTRTILNLGQTCKRLQEVVKVPQLWQYLVQRYFPKTSHHINHSNTNTVNWLMMYKSDYLSKNHRRITKNKCLNASCQRQPFSWKCTQPLPYYHRYFQTMYPCHCHSATSIFVSDYTLRNSFKHFCSPRTSIGFETIY